MSAPGEGGPTGRGSGDPSERWDPELEGLAGDQPRPVVDRRSLSFQSSSASHIHLEGKDAPPLPDGIASVVHLAESINGRQSVRVRVTYNDGRVADYASLDDAPAEVRAFLATLPMPAGTSGQELLAAALEQIGATRARDGVFTLKVGSSELPNDLRKVLGSAGSIQDPAGRQVANFTVGSTGSGGFVLKLIAAALILIAGLLLYLALR